MHGQAVFKAVHATGIFGDIATDRASNLRRGVGGVVQAIRGGSLGDSQVAYPRLHAGGTRRGVNLEDLVEARHHQQHPLGQWQGAAREPCACTARDNWHLVVMTHNKDRLDLLDPRGQNHEQRRGAIRRQAVALIGLEVFILRQDIQVRQSLT
ncbi:hypothetical protein D3C79_632590 [compost metagenome]